MLDRMLLRQIALFGLMLACGLVDGAHLGNIAKSPKSSLVSTNLISSNLVMVSGPNLTASIVSTSISSVSGNSTNDPFLIDELPTTPQNTKSKFYTVKNGTINSLTAVKYKRNNTERSNDQSSQFKREDQFTSFGCDLCTADKNCTKGQTCNVYFKCSNSTPGHRNASNDLNSNLSSLSSKLGGLSTLNGDLSNQHLSDLKPFIVPSNSAKDALDSALNSSVLPSSFLIAKQFYCDSICDCSQCDDEINCSLTKCDKPNEIMCQDKSSCIEPSKICDSSFDCKDHSDEIGCCIVSYLF